MASKWFLPRAQDLESEVLYGLFPCQEDDCDHESSSAEWFKGANLLVWDCKHGHRNKVVASDYV